MQTKQTKAPGIVKLVLKLLAVLFLAFTLVQLLGFVVESVSGVDGAPTKADAIEWCEDDYRSRNFPDLYTTLTLYDLYDDTYDVYWEAVNGYNTLICYDQWQQAARMGMDGAEKQAQTFYDTLSDMAKSPACPENAKLLNRFLQQAGALSQPEQSEHQKSSPLRAMSLSSIISFMGLIEEAASNSGKSQTTGCFSKMGMPKKQIKKSAEKFCSNRYDYATL